MKEGRSLPDLAAELERQLAAKKDVLADAGDLGVRSNGHTDLVLGEAYPLRDVAHGQLAEYLQIPKTFYDRLRGHTDLTVPVAPETLAGDDSPDNPADKPLFDVVVNSLLSDKAGDRRLVRTLDGQARAFLSENFNVDLDNHDVFLMAAKVLNDANLGPEHVVSAEVTEKRLYLKVVSPRLEAVVRPENVRDGHGFLHEPQVVRAGFVLSNSEVGLGSLSVQTLVFKLMCQNGWILEEGFRARHVGRTLETDASGGIYRSDTRLADQKARLLKIRDHVHAALDETRFLELVGKIQQSADVPLTGGIEKTVEVAAKRFALSQGEKESVLRDLIEGADLSLWGLSNAVTATAGRARDYDRATELEAIGGRLVTMPSSEVRELVGAY